MFFNTHKKREPEGPLLVSVYDYALNTKRKALSPEKGRNPTFLYIVTRGSVLEYSLHDLARNLLLGDVGSDLKASHLVWSVKVVRHVEHGSLLEHWRS